jgi:hypothetical protein
MAMEINLVITALSNFINQINFSINNFPALSIADKVMDFSTQANTLIAANNLPLTPTIIIAIALIAATIIFIFLAKRILINSLFGIILWAVLEFGIKAGLPFIPSFVIGLIFGPAGLGAMLLLKFMGFA